VAKNRGTVKECVDMRTKGRAVGGSELHGNRKKPGFRENWNPLLGGGGGVKKKKKKTTPPPPGGNREDRGLATILNRKSSVK